MNIKSFKIWRSLFEKIGVFRIYKTKQANTSKIIFESPLPSEGYYTYNDEGLIYEFEYSLIYEPLVDRLRGEGWHVKLCVKIGGYLRYQVVYG